MRLAFLALLIACSTPAPEPPEVRTAMVRLGVALDRALEALDEGDQRAAQVAWRDAHEVWQNRLAPGLRDQIDERELVILELHLARLRAAIDGGPGDARREVKGLRQGLASPIASLP